MATEQRLKLKSVTARVPISDYAKLMQLVDGGGVYKDMSSAVRDAVAKWTSDIELDQQHAEWVEANKNEYSERGSKKSHKKIGFGFRSIVKLFRSK